MKMIKNEVLFFLFTNTVLIWLNELKKLKNFTSQ